MTSAHVRRSQTCTGELTMKLTATKSAHQNDLLAAARESLEPLATACCCLENGWDKGTCPACGAYALVDAAIATATETEEED